MTDNELHEEANRLRGELAAAQAREQEAREALNDTWWQFAYCDEDGNRRDMGLSALEGCSGVLSEQSDHAALDAALEKAKQGAEGKAAQAEARREQAYQQLSNLRGQQCELCSHFRSMVVQRDEALDKLAEARREGAEAALEPFRPLLVACGAGRSIGVPGVQTAAVVAAWDELADFFAKRKGAISGWANRCREIAAGIRALLLMEDAP